MRIDELPLPSKAISMFKKRGIETLYPPQEEAVKQGLLDGRNIVASIPTAAGKTLIAELAMMKKLLEEGGKALYMVPLRALASEKYEEFSKYYSELGLKVAISVGDYDSSDPWLAKYDVIVATNEKVDSLIRHGAPWLKDVEVIVADEIHLLNDAQRGPTLEVVLSRMMQLRPESQIIALSATIRNSDEIAEWLNASLVKSDWRPVPLREGVYYNGMIFFNQGDAVEIESRTRNPLADLCIDVLNDGGQVLIFVSTRHSAVSTAKRLRSYVMKLLSNEEKRALREIAGDIRREGERVKLTEDLAECVTCGVAFHHAGLSYTLRRIIEENFRNNKIKVIVATPTLAAGVNLPARRVIIRDYTRYVPGLGRVEIPVLEYKQMAGRAGRPKYDKIGEAILIATSEDDIDYLMNRYIKAEPELIWSKLGSEPAMRSHVLAMIATNMASVEEEIVDFMKKTFFALQNGVHMILNQLRNTLRFLMENELISSKGNSLKATTFGKRISELYIDPLSAIRIKEGLMNIKSTRTTPFSYLHLICHTPDMPKLYVRRSDLKWLEAFVESHYEEFLIPPPLEEDSIEYEAFLMEVKTALLLNDWIEEVDEDTLSRQYDVGPGDIYSISQTAEWLIYSTEEIARLLSLNEVAKELRVLRIRVKHGVRRELVELVQLKGIGRVKARILYQLGYKTLDDLRKASIEELVRIPSIGLSTAISIKQQLGVPISEERISKLKDYSKKTLLDWIS
ncbi:MAG: extensin [Thermoprotei archaeon]|nr:MAG: extensin [Thermoprotei archaeon]RLF19525.1 MAG: extensin [Thermoprotei archaeon]